MSLGALFPVFLLFWQTPALNAPELAKARDAQDRGALERIASQFSAAVAKQPGDAAAYYRLALTQSYLAEIAMETGDKNQARSAAETGIKAAVRASHSGQSADRFEIRPLRPG